MVFRFVLVLVLAAATASAAAAATPSGEHAAFTGSATQNTVSGSITAGAPQYYDVTGYRGQTLTVTVIHEDPGVTSVSLQFEGGDVAKIASARKTFSFTFTESNGYVIKVAGTSAKPARYVLHFALTGKKPAHAEPGSFSD